MDGWRKGGRNWEGGKGREGVRKGEGGSEEGRERGKEGGNEREGRQTKQNTGQAPRDRSSGTLLFFFHPAHLSFATISLSPDHHGNHTTWITMETTQLHTGRHLNSRYIIMI